MVTWLVQLETKIRNQATTRGKDFRTTLGPDPEFPAKDIAGADALLHIGAPVCGSLNIEQSLHTSHAYLETFMLILTETFQQISEQKQTG